MVTTRRQLDAVGGFQALVDFLADDYQLGNRIANGAGRIALSPVVVECWESPKNWSEVWLHQLRWGRTIRVCRPLAYFFSILGNATLWPLLWWLVKLQSGLIRFSSTLWNYGGSIGGVISAPVIWNLFPCAWVFALCLLTRMLTALNQQQRLTQSYAHAPYFWLVPVKDLLNAAVWALAFLASTVQWRGQAYRLLRGGKLVKIS